MWITFCPAAPAKGDRPILLHNRGNVHFDALSSLP
jgi:hypothetical protein